MTGSSYVAKIQSNYITGQWLDFRAEHTHSINMGILGFPFVRDFFGSRCDYRNLLVCNKLADDAIDTCDTGRYSQLLKHVRCRMAKYIECPIQVVAK